MVFGCGISASHFRVNGVSDMASCSAKIGDLIEVYARATFDAFTLSLSNPIRQNGALYWYEFTFPALGADHILLGIFFSTAPLYTQVFKWVNNLNWVSVGASEYLDTIDPTATYGMWISTAIGWSKNYNAKGQARAYWSITKPDGLTYPITTGYGAFQTGDSKEYIVYIGTAVEGTYTIVDTFIEFSNGGVCY